MDTIPESVGLQVFPVYRFSLSSACTRMRYYADPTYPALIPLGAAVLVPHLGVLNGTNRFHGASGDDLSLAEVVLGYPQHQSP